MKPNGPATKTFNINNTKLYTGTNLLNDFCCSRGLNFKEDNTKCQAINYDIKHTTREILKVC